jgi:hypothetical protein
MKPGLRGPMAAIAGESSCTRNSKVFFMPGSLCYVQTPDVSLSEEMQTVSLLIALSITVSLL